MLPVVIVYVHPLSHLPCRLRQWQTHRQHISRYVGLHRQLYQCDIVLKVSVDILAGNVHSFRLYDLQRLSALINLRAIDFSFGIVFAEFNIYAVKEVDVCGVEM